MAVRPTRWARVLARARASPVDLGAPLDPEGFEFPPARPVALDPVGGRCCVGVFESGSVAVCGVAGRDPWETVGAETCGTETCGTDTCGTDTCGTETCGTETCGTETCGTETCGTDLRADTCGNEGTVTCGTCTSGSGNDAACTVWAAASAIAPAMSNPCQARSRPTPSPFGARALLLHSRYQIVGAGKRPALAFRLALGLQRPRRLEHVARRALEPAGRGSTRPGRPRPRPRRRRARTGGSGRAAATPPCSRAG